MTTKKQRHAEVQKRACNGNVQAGTPVQAGVGMRLNSLITMMRSQNDQALNRIFQDSRLKCPSGSQFLKDLDMDMKVDFIWFPIDRVAMLMDKNLKTIRRMVDAGKLTALKHQIPTKNGATIKTFVLATEEIIQAEYDRFRDSLRKPELYFEEVIDLGEHSYPSVFLVYYDNGNELVVKSSEKAGGSDVSL
ncbi:MAG: hypothetical protein PWP64_1333 [Candidatus Cloacimonadota bacterium]|nr:hypothetical protein [Candidatus Cloacimonadota bacterium]MDK2851188.1 hypothetical protein [Candidatus Cloacimonadota bacterium]